MVSLTEVESNDSQDSKTMQDPDELEFILILFGDEMADDVCKIIKFVKSGFNLLKTDIKWEKQEEKLITNPDDKQSRLLNAFYIDHEIVLVTARRCIILDKYDLSEKIQVSFEKDIKTENKV